MERADKGLAFMMQYENVAWYDSGQVRILDRRVYPRKVEFVAAARASYSTRSLSSVRYSPFSYSTLPSTMVMHTSLPCAL